MTARLDEALRRALRDLSDVGAPAALIGGLAVSAWTEPRFTRDADLAVAVESDAQAEQVLFAMQQRGHRLIATIEHKSAGRLATARTQHTNDGAGGVITDLLFASCGLEPEVVGSATPLDIGFAEPVRVARIGHLVALKLLSNDPVRRPQDALDLRALRCVIDADELTRARDGCAAIMARGFARDRDLLALFEAWRQTPV